MHYLPSYQQAVLNELFIDTDEEEKMEEFVRKHGRVAKLYGTYWSFQDDCIAEVNIGVFAGTRITTPNLDDKRNNRNGVLTDSVFVSCILGHEPKFKKSCFLEPVQKNTICYEFVMFYADFL